MTEQQQYRVTADRELGDPIRKRFMRGDRVTFGTNDAGRTVPVRIERPVPTTVVIHELVGLPLPPDEHPSLPRRKQIAEAMPSRVEIHRIICGQLGGPSTHDHQACENAANAVHDALLQKGADR